MNRLALSIAPVDTAQALMLLHRHSTRVFAAEVRVDAMQSVDLPRLLSFAPVPLIITCRPTREGGMYTGSEHSRLEILSTAMALGAAYVDVEWDAAVYLPRSTGRTTRVIVSRHWYDSTPANIHEHHEELRDFGDVVKLVGTVSTPEDVHQILKAQATAQAPLMCLGMGAGGELTRLTVPFFQHAFATYAAASPDAVTAPGQFTVHALYERSALHTVTPGTPATVTLRNGAEVGVRVNAGRATFTLPDEPFYRSVHVHLETALGGRRSPDHVHV